MKKEILLICSIVLVLKGFSQVSSDYTTLIKKAETLYQKKDYKNSAPTYSQAFQFNGWKALPEDRFNAACAWSMVSEPDSAFYNLEKLVSKANYSDFEQITSSPALLSLHNDSRWKSLLEKVRKNKERLDLYQPVILQLDSIYEDDQQYRKMLRKKENDSLQLAELWKLIIKKDSINLVKVKAILNQYGWLGMYDIGQKGNTTLFLVIQHADLPTQEKYLPLIREAVKNGKAQASHLALLEDRVALRQGKKQIYGSQISRDNKTGKYFIEPIEDEPNVNKRRAEVGLGPLEEYVKQWNIDYKLPAQ